MWVAFAFAKATHSFFSKNISVCAIINDQIFNDMLTNDIVCFEQLGPDVLLIWARVWHFLQYCMCAKQRLRSAYTAWSVLTVSIYRKMLWILKATHKVPCKDSNQTVGMHRLIWVFAGCTCNLLGNSVSRFIFSKKTGCDISCKLFPKMALSTYLSNGGKFFLYINVIWSRHSQRSR